MVRESICKINLGLNIVRRREDGYHDIQTVMYPVAGLRDVVELHKAEHFAFSTSGIQLADCPTEQNLCVKAFRLMQNRYGIGNAKIDLHKVIPTGAGLGGGSSNATTVLMLCNEEWKLGLSDESLRKLAAELGSDTPFFVRPQPQLAKGRGEILTPFALSVNGLWLAMIKPSEGVSTAQAYSAVSPHIASPTIEQALAHPVTHWKEILKNDFEPSVFARLPRLAEIKAQMYRKGAIYAAMSGSGSTIFGLFESKPEIADSDNFTHIEQL